MAEPQQPSREVRRCARCRRPSLAFVRAWRHRFAGIDTRTETLELRCQACGEEVVLRPATEIRAERILGFLLLPAIFPGVFFLLRARQKTRAWIDNPVVGGAAAAPVPGPRDRRCACSASATCVGIAQQGGWGRSLGRRYEHACARCGARFAVHDVRGIVTASLIACAFTAAGALVIAHPPGAALHATASNRWFGVGMVGCGGLAWVCFAARVRSRRAHPKILPSEDGPETFVDPRQLGRP